MPGSIQTAAPATVLPRTLCRAFVHSREYPVIDNDYRNGESQCSVQAATSRKRWRLTKRLTPAQLWKASKEHRLGHQGLILNLPAMLAGRAATAFGG